MAQDNHSEVSELSPSRGPGPCPVGTVNDGEKGPVYCVCRRPDINCFMIGCDCCSEWFHGNCIGISEKAAKAIRVWYCDKCRAKDGSLEIKYRPKKTKEPKVKLENETDPDKTEKQHPDAPDLKIERRRGSRVSNIHHFTDQVP
ncbi:hypothetical protein UPYG_G00001390 [Umbra pygmaea]|uniref:CXXC-type zinc finger protein 1 n=1 Tax=Umbra pygmaea TaxID=75934 RepID=A0ABD0XJ81_UMBPY